MNKDTSNTEKLVEIKKITYYGMFINLFLSILKIITGFLGHSQAAIADGVHSLSDLTTDVAILVGVKYWSAPPDEEHPYGHGRIETIVTTFIGFILALTALGIGWEAVSTIRDEHLENPTWFSLIGISFSIVLKEILYRVTMRYSKKHSSRSLEANAWHHRTDAFSSIPAFIAVFISVNYPSLAFIDHIGAIIVAVIIFRVAWQIFSRSFSELTDKGAEKGDIEKIKDIVLLIEDVKEVHGIRSRKHGSDTFVDLHVLVDDDLTVKQGHDIADKVIDVLLKEGPEISDVVVHIEPFTLSKKD
ncbi:MAG: cation transporter [Candidatus Delongbacteria bacterium]|nr:cation transporter [Candidatus Delongbacteria bacterium]